VGLPAPDTPGEYRDTPDYQILAEVQTYEAVVGCGMIIQRELRQIIAEASFTSELNLRSCAAPRRLIPPVDRLDPRRERRADNRVVMASASTHRVPSPASVATLHR